MPDLSDFVPLASETVASIRARVDADVNAGLSVNDEDYVDTLEGGMYHSLTQPLIIEIGRLWDFISVEAIAAVFPAFSWGDYLDEHGELVGVGRKDASPATGSVTFDAGAPVATAVLIPTGALIATTQQAPDDDPITFEVVAGGTIAIGQQLIALNVVADQVGAEGNVAANQIDQLLTPVDGVASVYNTTATSGGADVETDEAYRTRVLLEWHGTDGAGTVTDYQRWALSYPGIGYASVEAISFGAGTVAVAITDANNRPFSGSAEVNGVQALIDPATATTTTTGSHTLPVGTINVVSTAGMDAAGKVIIKAAAGPQVVTYTGKTGTTLTGATGGTGVIAAGTTVMQSGKGVGLAPIGAVVAVSTPTLKNITIAATVTPLSGYTLDGTAGTIAIRSDVVAALSDYVDHLPPGADVVYNHVLARFFAVVGVVDVTGLTLNGAGVTIVVATNEVAALSSTAGIV